MQSKARPERVTVSKACVPKAVKVPVEGSTTPRTFVEVSDVTEAKISPEDGSRAKALHDSSGAPEYSITLEEAPLVACSPVFPFMATMLGT